ncbi:MAG: low molecular weight phosphatase family protein [Euryarchaeota archaeon]|nr:low molecular weight phosphatase family protein [Euryarchaeota archaeon]MED6345708.1 arsenate reductase ArsC [Candidatus Thermoplasmatota archaeon]
MRFLFVCVGNTCRSQMAEAIARDLGHEAASAGTHAPESGRVAQYAIEVLEEIGIDTSGLRPKNIESVYPGEYDAIISMGCGVSCPSVPIDEDWGLEDPHGEEREVYRKTRDAIRILVTNLVGSYTDA